VGTISKKSLFTRDCRRKNYDDNGAEWADGLYEAGSIGTTAFAERDDYIINGTKLFVPDAHVADYILCVARTSNEKDEKKGITVFIVPAKEKGIKCHAAADDERR